MHGKGPLHVQHLCYEDPLQGRVTGKDACMPMLLGRAGRPSQADQGRQLFFQNKRVKWECLGNSVAFWMFSLLLLLAFT